MNKKNSPLNPDGDIRGKLLCSCCVYMYLEQDSKVIEQLKMSIWREIYLFLYHVLMHSPIYFTLPRGGSSPPLVQYLYIISKCSSFQALFKLFSSSLPYQLKNLIKSEGKEFSQSR